MTIPPQDSTRFASELLTSQEVSRLLRVDQSSVNGWVRQGRLKACKTPGGHNRFEASELSRFLRDTGLQVPDALLRSTERRLLVVDDDNRELARWRRHIGRSNENIVLRCADNGVEALLQVGVFRPHLVVLDFVMPGLNGLEVCRRMKNMPEVKDVHVVLLSGAISAQVAEEALDAGALAAWSKPQPISTILSLLDGALVHAPS
jgi:excisionase family DNA binding protein